MSLIIIPQYLWLTKSYFLLLSAHAFAWNLVNIYTLHWWYKRPIKWLKVKRLFYETRDRNCIPHTFDNFFLLLFNSQTFYIKLVFHAMAKWKKNADVTMELRLKPINPHYVTQIFCTIFVIIGDKSSLYLTFLDKRKLNCINLLD